MCVCFLNPATQVFTSVFTTECILKLGALGLDFFRNGWNVFDFVIVLASLVDLGLEIVNGLSVLRGMRLVSRNPYKFKEIKNLSLLKLKFDGIR